MKRKRKVFKIRFDINPNSSGHGFSMGLMLLLPIFLINVIFLSFNSKISKLLNEIKLEEKKLSKFGKLLLFFIWIIPWFYTIIFMEALTGLSFGIIIPIYYKIIVSGIIILPLYLLIKKSIDNKKLYYITTKTFKYSTIISTAIFVILSLFLKDTIFGNLLYSINILFVYPLILNLTISIYMFNNYEFSIDAVYGIFVIGCLITLFPFIIFPFNRNNYNPVSVFFPFWIYLFPLFITIKSLIDLNKRSENTKN
ncbi:MAG: hypothetical protein H5U37_04505 [Caldisericia bacterium]|nr:hypothetical protein [Caldisericia bacterium]